MPRDAYTRKILSCVGLFLKCYEKWPVQAKCSNQVLSCYSSEAHKIETIHHQQPGSRVLGARGYAEMQQQSLPFRSLTLAEEMKEEAGNHPSTKPGRSYEGLGMSGGLWGGGRSQGARPSLHAAHGPCLRRITHILGPEPCTPPPALP